MLLAEIISESAVGTLFVGGQLEIVVDDHAIARADLRGVDPRAVDYTLRRLNRHLDKLSSIESGEKFWVYDWSREIALGLRRISSTKLKFILKTVYPEKPARTPSADKIITI
jgi:hypothetical protein